MHGAEWGPASNALKHLVPRVDPKLQKMVTSNHLTRFLGYGTVSLPRLFECEENRATLIGCGVLRHEEGHRYLLPLPKAIGNNQIERRLTVTLAWLTPIVSNQQAYKKAALWFELQHQDLSVVRQEVDRHAVRRGTVQHEIFSGDEVVTVEDGSSIAISVNCRELTGSLSEAVPYGLVVSLETRGELVLPIYEQVRARIAIQVKT